MSPSISASTFALTFSVLVAAVTGLLGLLPALPPRRASSPICAARRRRRSGRPAMALRDAPWRVA
jgi:hypothetical protein